MELSTEIGELEEAIITKFKDCKTVDEAMKLSCEYPHMIKHLPHKMKLSVDVAKTTGLVVDIK